MLLGACHIDGLTHATPAVASSYPCSDFFVGGSFSRDDCTQVGLLEGADFLELLLIHFDIHFHESVVSHGQWRMLTSLAVIVEVLSIFLP